MDSDFSSLETVFSESRQKFMRITLCAINIFHISCQWVVKNDVRDRVS